jgi:hypothetical protein
MRIGSDGNVGIGTNNPDARLHLEEPSDISATTRLFHTENGFTGGSVGHFEIVEKKTGAGTGWSDFTLRLQRRVDTTEQGYIEFNPSGSTGDYGIAFGNSGGGGPGEIMRIVGQSGNVGIGTTSPGASLEVHGPDLTGEAAGTTSLISRHVSGLDGVLNIFGVAAGNGEETLGLQTQIDNRAWASDIAAGWDTGSASRYNLLLQPYKGNVGIGTTNPSAKLQVGGNAETAPQYLWIRGNRVNEAGDIAGIHFYNSLNSGDRGNSRIISSRGTNNYGSNLEFWTNPDDNVPALERMRILANGNVDIGVTSSVGILNLGGNNVVKSWNAFNNNSSAGDYTFPRNCVAIAHFHFAGGQDRNIAASYRITVPYNGTPVIEVLYSGSFVNATVGHGAHIVRFFGQNLPSNYNGNNYQLRISQISYSGSY